MRLQEIMNPEVISIDAGETADVAWSRMQRHRIRHLVVTEDERLVGMLSERDLGGRNGAEIRKGRSVAELMSPRAVSAEPRTTLRQAAQLMGTRRIGCLPVFDEDRLVGIVTATDVLDQLGRGSTRPEVRAKRATLRRPPSTTKPLAGRPLERPRSPAQGKTGRARPRKPDSPRRAPFVGKRSRPTKRAAGRTEAPNVTAHISARGPELSPEDRTYIRRKLGMKLGKFAPAIERVSVRVEDVNGPRGGVDQVCRIKAVLSALPSVVVEAKDASLNAAIDGALSDVERAVRRSLQRSRSTARSRGEALSWT